MTWWSDQVRAEMGTLTREHGVNSFKHFMAYKGAMMVDDDVLLNSFGRALELGAICNVHAENGDAVYHLQQKLLAAGITGPEGHALSRPPEVEARGGAARHHHRRAARRADLYRPRLDRRGDRRHRAARARGQRVYGEVLAQHLLIDESVYRDPDWATAAAHVMSPPFRAKHHQEALWAGLVSGTLQTTATDHCCFCAPQKAAGRGRLHENPERHRRDRGPDERALAPWRRHRAADAEGVRPRHLDQRRADLQHLPAQGRRRRRLRTPIWWSGTRSASRTISAKTHHQNVDFNVFEGMTVTGLARHTISRGDLVWTDGDLRTRRGAGRYVPRPTFAPVLQALDRRNTLRRPVGVARGPT